MMKDKTVTRSDIADAVYSQMGLSRSDSEKLVKQVITEIIKSLVNNQMVKISAFGSFCLRKKKPRTGRNPKTGQEVEISSRRVLTFRAGAILKEKVENGISKEQ